MLKWVGSKARIVNIFKDNLPAEYNDYYEPFFGGGSLFFSLEPHESKHYYISDINHDLINLYKCIQEQCDTLVEALTDETDYKIRDNYCFLRTKFNEYVHHDITKAAMFYKLIHTSFNGLVRYNRQGKFNSAWGNRSFSFRESELRTFSSRLSKATLSAHGYEFSSPKKGDLLVCDPPYLAVEENGRMLDKLAYSSTEFCHERFGEWIQQQRNNGVKILLFNHSHSQLENLFGTGWNVVNYYLPKTFSGKKSSRTPTKEVLLRNY